MQLEVLHIDDCEMDLELIQLRLQKIDADIHITGVVSPERGLELAKEQGFDCIISDFQMPGMNGLELLESLKKEKVTTPFIFITGQGNEDLAVKALQAGAVDYFTKDRSIAHYSRLANSIRHAVERSAIRLKHSLTVGELEFAEGKYSAASNAISDAIVITELSSGIVTETNKGFERMFGYSREEAIGRTLRELKIYLNDNVRKPLVKEMMETRYIANREMKLAHRKGNIIDAIISAATFEHAGQPYAAVFAKDISTLKTMERQHRESEIKLSLLVNNIPSVTWQANERGIIVFTSEKIKDVLGYSAERIIGHPMIDSTILVHHEDRPRVIKHKKLLMEKVGTYTITYRIAHREGHYVWIIDNSISHRMHDGTMQIFGIFTDITEQKTVEMERLRSEQKYRNLFGLASDAIATFKLEKDSENTVLIDCNQAMASMFGYKIPEEMFGMSPWELSPARQPDGENSKSKAQAMVEIMLDQKSHFFDWIHAKRDGAEFPTEISLKMIDFDDDMYMHTIIRDITDRKNREAEILSANNDLKNALEEVSQLKQKLHQENIYLREEIDLEHNFYDIIGESTKLKEVLRQIQTVAQTDTRVLILGETGTGKELVARALHKISNRSEMPFIKVNCASLPTNLIESELFGHEKGAFTGAASRKHGRFELAHNGTIFLDEIGELPLEVQAKLLRILQEGEFERIGSSQTISVDVRIIAATNRNLETLVRQGNFRNDLYYRLNVFPITSPPLRDRKEDLGLLANHFIRKYNNKMGKNIAPINDDQLGTLKDYHWPGNIRELENVIERSVVVSGGTSLTLINSFKRPELAGQETIQSLDELIVSHIKKVLGLCGGKVSGPGGAAQLLKVNPYTLFSKMEKFGLKKSDS